MSTENKLTPFVGRTVTFWRSLHAGGPVHSFTGRVLSVAVCDLGGSPFPYAVVEERGGHYGLLQEGYFDCTHVTDVVELASHPTMDGRAAGG